MTRRQNARVYRAGSEHENIGQSQKDPLHYDGYLPLYIPVPVKLREQKTQQEMFKYFGFSKM